MLISLRRMPRRRLIFAGARGLAGYIDRQQEIVEVRRLARGAVRLGKDDATVLCDAGYALVYVARDLDDGSAFLDRALSINPNLAWGWSYNGWVNVRLGDPDRAVECFAYAMRLSPIDPRAFFIQEGISLLAVMMKRGRGQRRRCESCRITMPHCVSLLQVARLRVKPKKQVDGLRD
jgi:tetratricopeptide (TPR) repeat protein